jgi:very-short-patch-repair endonuclease
MDISAANYTARERLITLLEYIEHVEKLNRKPAFTIPTDFYAGYEHELRGLPGVEFDVTAEGDEVWLRVPRLKEEDPPEPPALLRSWLNQSKNPDKEPTLRDELVIDPRRPGAVAERIKRSSNAQIDHLFAQYLSEVWTPWAEHERPRRRTIALYNRLFLLEQVLEADGADTPLELVWGIGIALWQHPGGQLIRHPIISQPVEISLDLQSLALQVRPRDRAPVLESDPFVALNIAGVVHVESAWRQHLLQAEKTLSPFDPKSFEGVLKSSVGFLDAGGHYWPELRRNPADRRPPAAAEHLFVTDTWVIYARRRSPNFLIEDLERLRRALTTSAILPEGPASLVSELSDDVTSRPQVRFRGLSYENVETPEGVQQQELYFPKPYNEEQVSIVEKLETSPGVVVQGPPGTGKTHTIANVICHYLANGKKVLVTSKGEPALAVLREQIPEEVRALTVALLSDEKDGLRQFEHAIQSIASTVAHINPNEVEREIRALTQRVDELHTELVATDREIAAWAALHLTRVSFHGRDVLPQELARYIVEHEAEHAWFPDQLPARPIDLLFSDEDIDSIRQARQELGADLSYLDVDLPPADGFPDAAVMAGVHQDLIRAAELATKMKAEKLPPLIDTAATTLEQAQQLLARAQEALRVYDQVYGEAQGYSAALHRAFQSEAHPTLTTLQELCSMLNDLARERQAFLQRPVQLHESADLEPEFLEAVDRASSGKSPIAWLAFGKVEIKTHLQNVTVGGLRPESEHDWQHVRSCLALRRRIRKAVASWNACVDELGLPSAPPSPWEALRILIGHVQHIALVERLARSFDPELESLSEQVFGRSGTVSRPTRSRAALSELTDWLDQHLTHHRLSDNEATVAACIDALAGKQGAVSEGMRTFLTAELGKPALSVAQATERWSGLLADLNRLESLQGAFDEVARVADLVERSGGPEWAKALRLQPALNNEDPWTPRNWHDAWQARHVSAYLEEIDGREPLRKLQTVRKDTERDLANVYRQLVSQKTWLEVYRNSSPGVKSALQAYLNAVRRIGKGTGIRASRYRNEARSAMLEAYRAVPCWIMSQWRVSETLPPEIGKFDLVIIDEASQSDLWALPSLLRGAKLMVVGDDKQVSPDGIGLAEEAIKDLKSRFLGKQIHGDQMTPEKSLYDLAKVVFAGDMVVLREHFRCVAPIIEFSKREFYNHEIQPLRTPRRSERLDPPLIDVLVKGSTRDGKINEAEARAIVEEIQNILRDPRCAGRSIGVVSLLGIEQAHRIFELAKEAIPAEEIVARKLTAGDARTFQGKERDIMLLSMVATSDQKTTATGSIYEQRFNVAASRARDRMYLFRSVELSKLNQTDLKARLIEHFSAPFHEEKPEVTSLRELCQSEFERELYDALTESGYRVTPHVKVGSYSIDLVVEGEMDRRLAIECDGDQYHGQESWVHDMARQRILERAGWTFWRCFAATFVRHPKVVLQELLGTLNRMGIEPVKTNDLDLGRYTEHREASPFGRPAAAHDAVAESHEAADEGLAS